MAKAEEAAELLRAAEARAASDLSFREALKLAEEAEAIYEEAHDNAGRAKALRAVISFQRRLAPQGEPPVAARQIANEELNLARETGDRHLEAAMLLSLVELSACGRRGREEKRREALAWALEAAAAFRELEDQRSEAAALLQVSNLFIKFSETGSGPKAAREAAKYAEEALALSKESGDLEGEGKALHNISVARWLSNAPFKDGMFPAVGALRIWRTQGVKRLEGFELHSIASWHLKKGKAQEGLQYAKDALRVWRELGDAGGWEAACLAVLSAIYASIEETGKAVEVVQEGVQHFRSSGDYLYEAQSLQVLAAARLQDSDRKGAVQAVEESLALCEEVGTEQERTECLHLASEVFLKTDKPQEAVASLERSVDLAHEAGDARREAYLLTEQARLHLLAHEPSRGLECAEDAAEIYQQCGDKNGEGIAQLRTAVARLLMQRYDQAAQAAELSRGLFVEVQDLPNQASALRLLAEVHSLKEEDEAALRATNTARSIYQRLGDRFNEAAMLVQVAQLQLSLALAGDAVAERHRQRRGPAAAAAAAEAEEAAGLRWDASLKSGRDALQMARRLQGAQAERLVANAHAAVAMTQGMCGMYQEALKSAELSLDIWQELGEPSGQVASLVLTGEIHRANGHQEEAEGVARQAQEAAQLAGDAAGEAQATDLLQRLRPEDEEYDEGDYADHARAAPVERPSPRAQPEAAADSPAGAAPAAVYKGPTLEILLDKVNQMALELLQSDTFEHDQPLMDAGLDSLAMVQFRNSLQQTFPGVPMPASLLFDNPSVRALAENVNTELRAIHDRQHGGA